jgi:hypothetical protein
MTPGILIALSVLGCLAVGAALVFVIHMVARPGSLPVTADWIDELSMDRYRPMLRLLDEREFQELRSHPGFTPQMASQLRRQRCRIFRGYLRSLSGDFSRVCMALLGSGHRRGSQPAPGVRRVTNRTADAGSRHHDVGHLTRSR